MEVEKRTFRHKARPLSATDSHATSRVFSLDSTGQAPAYVRRPSSTEEPGVELGHSEDVLDAKCLPKAHHCHMIPTIKCSGYLTHCVDASP